MPPCCSYSRDYGAAAAITGRLTTIDGAPLPDQPLAVSRHLRRPGATATPFATAVTVFPYDLGYSPSVVVRVR